MLKWKIEKNVIKELFYNDKNIINPWGIETADSWSFFSMEEGIGYRFTVLDKKISVSNDRLTSFFHVKMREGEWILETADIIVGNSISRTAKLKCITDSIFMDFVVRFRFKKYFFSSGEIANKKIKHTSSNVYHQFEVTHASLVGDALSVDVKIVEAKTNNKFTPCLYIRDHQDEWVVHARMIPIGADKEVIKLCSRYFKTSPLPNFLTKVILSSKKIKNYLWYHSEHSPYKSRLANFFSPNAFPMIKLYAGQEIEWKVEIQINEQ